MKRGCLRNLCICLSLCFCTCMQAGAQSLRGMVGGLGDSARLEFAGMSTFTAGELRQALLCDSEYQLASHPAALLRDYLPAVQTLVETGYQHCGFAEAQVSVVLTPDRDKVVVTVSEGPRYFCGDIELKGVQTLSLDQFVSSMTEPRIKETRSDPSKSSRGPKTEDPIWQRDKPAPFSARSQKALMNGTRSVLGELGYYFAEFSLEVVPEPDTARACLVVTIDEEGLRRIDEIIISGNEKDTREEILRYLGLKEGMSLDRALVRKTEDLLWHSARFLKHRVVPEVDKEDAVVRLDRVYASGFQRVE